jgi:hypothetical protein
MREPLDVMISLVNTNNRELVLACLRSLPAACAELSWAVTVVDNGSTDGSAETVAREFPDAAILRNKRRLGITTNHNQVLVPAIAGGSARYALILNEDTELDPGSVTELVQLCDREPGLATAGPRIRDADGRPQLSYFPIPTVFDQIWYSLRQPTEPRIRRGRGWLNTSCALVRVAALREIGPLDERFFIFYDDTDLGRRLADAGWAATVCPTATIVHYGHQTVSQPALGNSMERQFIRSRYLYFCKHHGRAAAAVVDGGNRLILSVRAFKAAVSALRHRTGAGARARMLWRLAAYNPRSPLPHEL